MFLSGAITYNEDARADNNALASNAHLRGNAVTPDAGADGEYDADAEVFLDADDNGDADDMPLAYPDRYAKPNDVAVRDYRDTYAEWNDYPEENSVVNETDANTQYDPKSDDGVGVFAHDGNADHKDDADFEDEDNNGSSKSNKAGNCCTDSDTTDGDAISTDVSIAEHSSRRNRWK